MTDIGPFVHSGDLRAGDRVLVSLLRSCGRCECCEAGVPAQCVTEFAIDAAPRLADGRGRPVRAGLRVGGFAESVVVDASQVVKIPAFVADEAACLISCGVMTGFGAAINTAKVQVGDSVAVIGCGGVGLNCVQGAALAGALPLVAIDVAADKLEQARTFGATETVDAADGDMAEKALALTDGRGFDVVMTAVGSARAIEAALPLLAREGALVVVGMPPDDERVGLERDRARPPRPAHPGLQDGVRAAQDRRAEALSPVPRRAAQARRADLLAPSARRHQRVDRALPALAQPASRDRVPRRRRHRVTMPRA